MNWVWKNSQSKHGSRLVLLAVADAMHTEKAWAWFSNAGLRQKTNLGQRSVQDAVTDLLKLGEVEVEYQTGPGGCNRYRVIMQTPAESAPPPQNPHPAESAPSGEPGESESSQVNDQTPAESAPPADIAGVRILHPDPAESAPVTHKNPKNSPAESSKGGVGGDESSPLFGANGTPPRRVHAKPTRLKPGPEFERFYDAYPVHKARGDAEKAWVQVTRAGADPEVLIAAALRYQQDPQVLRGYGKYPAGWLRAKCWLDEPTETPPPNANGARQTNYADEEYHGGW